MVNLGGEIQFLWIITFSGQSQWQHCTPGPERPADLQDSPTITHTWQASRSVFIEIFSLYKNFSFSRQKILHLLWSGEGRGEFSLRAAGRGEIFRNAWEMRPEKNLVLRGGGFYLVQHFCMVPDMHVWPKILPRPAKKKNARQAPHRISPIKTPIFLFSLSAPRIGFTSFTAPLKTLRGEPRVCGVSNFCGTNKFALEFTACLDQFVDFALRGFETENSKM